MSNKDHTPDGLSAEDLEKDLPPADFERGAGGEPLITNPTTGKRERYTRTSSLGDTLDEKSGLNNWLVAKAMEGVVKNGDLHARVAAVVPYEDHKSAWTQLRQDAILAGRGSYTADIGTAVHAMSERWEREPSYDPGEPYRSALYSYSEKMEALGLESVEFEIQIVNDEFRIAGTTDRVYETTKPLRTPDGHIIPAGVLLIGDIKTGTSLEYSLPGYTVQMAGYAGGQFYDVETNEYLPTPAINQDWGIIMKIGVEEGTCEFLWVCLADGREGARLANDVREWRRTWRRKNGRKASCVPVQVADGSGVTTPAELEPAESESESVPDPTPDARPDEGDLEAWREYARARLSAIRSHGEAERWMVIRWPEGLKPPKRLESLDDARALSEFLDRVEAQFGLPFVAGQPVGAPISKGTTTFDAGQKQ